MMLTQTVNIQEKSGRAVSLDLHAGDDFIALAELPGPIDALHGGLVDTEHREIFMKLAGIPDFGQSYCHGWLLLVLLVH